MTLFEAPFPHVQRSEAILAKLWRDVEGDHGEYHRSDVKIDSYVMLDVRAP